jgi:hypothetical protein
MLALPAVPADAGPASVQFADGRVTVEASEGALSDLLHELAQRAGLHLVLTQAPTGAISATFSGVPIEEGVRRLLRGRSFVLVYAADRRLSDIRLLGGEAAEGGYGIARGQSVEEANLGAAAQGASTPAPPAGIPARSPTPVAELAQIVVEDENAAVRARATAALAVAGGPAGIQALRKALEDNEAMVRVHAVHALSRAERAAAIPTLWKVLANDRDPQVRLAVARALGSIGSPDARLALEVATSDANEDVRDEAQRGLARLSRASR